MNIKAIGLFSAASLSAATPLIRDTRVGNPATAEPPRITASDTTPPADPTPAPYPEDLVCGANYTPNLVRRPHVHSPVEPLKRNRRRRN